MGWPKGKPRGEKVPGSGRKKGSVSYLTKKVQEGMQDGLLPLQVMLTVMSDHWKAAQDETLTDEARAAFKALAVQVAEKAAPYLHARLSAVDSTVTAKHEHHVISDKPPTDDEWASMYGGVAPSAGSAESVDRLPN